MVLSISICKLFIFHRNTGIITDTGTCIIHRNKAGPLWITFLLLNIVTISLNSNVPPSNENMYPYHKVLLTVL